MSHRASERSAELRPCDLHFVYISFYLGSLFASIAATHVHHQLLGGTPDLGTIHSAIIYVAAGDFVHTRLSCTGLVGHAQMLQKTVEIFLPHSELHHHAE